MPKPAQIASFGQDGEGQNGADAGNLLQTTEVIVVSEIALSPLFQFLPKLAEPAHLLEQNPEHGHCFRIFSHRQPDGTLGSMVDIFQELFLAKMPSLGKNGHGSPTRRSSWQ